MRRFRPSRRARAALLLGAAALAFSAAAAGRAEQGPSAGRQSEEELATVGEALVNKVCDTSCHGLEKLDEMRRTSREWNAQVTDMVGRGAVATEPQFATITKYLTRYYGLVGVNTAPAEELSAVLGLSDKDAKAIVAYRMAHGKFADAAALSKVPGIDKNKIEEQTDALRFN